MEIISLKTSMLIRKTPLLISLWSHQRVEYTLKVLGVHKTSALPFLSESTAIDLCMQRGSLLFLVRCLQKQTSVGIYEHVPLALHIVAFNRILWDFNVPLTFKRITTWLSCARALNISILVPQGGPIKQMLVVPLHVLAKKFLCSFYFARKQACGV